MIELSGGWDDYDIVNKFDEDNLGNIFIMDKVTYNKIQGVKSPKTGRMLITICPFDGPMINDCKIIIVNDKCFLKGVDKYKPENKDFIEVGEEIDRVYMAAFKLIQAYPHQWTTEACPTCRAVSELIRNPFGCEAQFEKG